MDISPLKLEQYSDSHYQTLDAEFVKRHGIAYTPQWIAEHITKNAFDQWRKLNQGKKAMSAADLCCGTGIFLRELINQINSLKWSTLISGFDIDSKAIALSRTVFSNSKLIEEISVQDTLISSYDLLAPTEKKYDIIVGNPPYVNAANIEQEYKNTLKNKYYVAQSGAFDLSLVYIEKTIASLNEGGVASLILSNKFMTSKYGKIACELLATKCNILKIEDFDDLQLFPGLTTYTCIITFIKSAPGKKHTLVKYLTGNEHRIKSLPRSKTETIEHNSLLTHPWNFHSVEDAQIHRKLSSGSLPEILDIFTGIQQGIRTGANDVFIVDNNKFPAHSKGCLLSYVSGEDIKSLDIDGDNVTQRLIYPYHYQNSKVSQFTEKHLKELHPEIYEHLLSHKTKLQSRSLQGNTQWFEFSRSQSLDVVSKPKILIREMMPKAIFSFDCNGEFAFSSGYALTCEKLSSIEGRVWAAILSTPTMEFSMRNVGTQLHSGWFRIMKNHILNLKLPKLSDKEFNELISLTRETVTQEQAVKIDEIVANAFGLSVDELSYIHASLKEIHQKSCPVESKSKESESLSKYEPVKLSEYDKFHVERDDLRQGVTFSPNKKVSIHNWYKYTQGYSASLVNYLLDNVNLSSRSIVLDPFNGSGTTTTVCSYRGIKSIGYEISPLMCEIARIKSRNWDIKLIHDSIEEFKKIKLIECKDRELIFPDYFEKAYAPRILNQIVSIAHWIECEDNPQVQDLFKLGLLSILEDVSKIRKHGSHYRFLDNTSSVGLQKLNIQVVDEDENIKDVLSQKLSVMYQDICSTGGSPKVQPEILCGSSLKTSLNDGSVDLVITSPPYLNRNNYISQQKAELDILGLISSKEDYKSLVKRSFRSHTDSDLKISTRSRFKEVNEILQNIELEEKNNAKIPHMIVGYFDDLDASLSEVFRLLKKGGGASFVVGNTRWGGVVVPIDHILCKLAESKGFQVESIYVTRLKGNSPQQMRKFGKISVRESIVNLRKK